MFNVVTSFIRICIYLIGY